MTNGSADSQKGKASWLELAISMTVEFLPIPCAVLGGLIGGVVGTLLLDWAIGLICAIVGAGAGLVIGFVMQALCSVLLIWGMAAKETIVTRNYVPLLCGFAAAVCAVVSIVLGGGGNDFGVITFGIIVFFTLGAGFGGAVQGIVRRLRR